MNLKSCLLVAVLATVVSAGPTGLRYSECASTCDESQNKFFYELGNKYEYRYEAETRTHLTTEESEEVTIKVSALATIQSLSACDFSLSVSDVVLHGSERSGEFAREVSRYPIKFAIQNGKIEHICSPNNEVSWITNFKKGILSNLQNSMTSFEESEILTETDVSGICETSYSSEKQGSEIIVTKTKVPSDCNNKPRIQQKFSTFGYSADSLVQNLPVMKSTQECKQYITNDIISKVYCEESHVFRPFGNKAGAETNVITSLKLEAVKPSSAIYIEPFSKISQLDLDYPEVKENKILESIESILSKLDLLSENGIKKEVPGLFTELVSNLKSVNQYQIQLLYQQSNSRVRTFLKDALPLVGTSDSIGAYVDLILSGNISEKEKKIWLTSLAFIKEPTLEMFSALQPLIDNNKENEALLGVSSLVYEYCLKDGDCQNKVQIKNMLKIFESRLGVGCRATSEEEQTKILYALKAIGNVGRFVNAEQILKRCYTEDNSMEIRIAAIDAMRRTPCSYWREENLLEMFKDQNQDNEIRIASYLGIMKCPTTNIINTIKDRLLSEGVNQVESFVWTHLTNLQETADQDKEWIRHLIGEEVLQKKFDSSSLKLSRNFESSFFLKEKNVGASVDSNVIFSSNSFLPRSSMVNMTVNLFGESINLFEFGGRIEGFEAYIEKFFGPNGYYPEETVAAIIKNLRQDQEKEETILESFFAKETSDPKGSYYLKLFGNELFYRHFVGIENALPDNVFSSVFDVISDLATKGNVDFTKSYSLIDSEFTFPTIAGFPIILNLNGSATMGLKMEGQFDFEGFNSMNIKGKLQPSAAVRFDAAVSVDAFLTKSGLKVISTLHSSTLVEGSVVVKGGKLVDLTIKVPQEKIEVFEMTNEFYKIENGVTTEKSETENKFENCYPIFCKSLGMEACLERSSNKIKVFLKKTNSHSSYVFNYSNTPSKTMILFDMPESKDSRKWSASLTKEPQQYEIDLISPKGSMNAKLTYVFDKDKIGMETLISFNDDQPYKAKFMIERRVGDTNNHFKVEALLETPSTNMEMFKLNGEANYDTASKSVDIQLSLSGAIVPHFSANLKLDKREEKYSIDINLSSPFINTSLYGEFEELTSDKGSVQLKGKYSLYSRPSTSITAQVKYQKQQKEDEVTYTGTASVDELDFTTTVEVGIAKERLSFNTKGKYRHITWDTQQFYSYNLSSEVKELKIKQIINIPHYNIHLVSERHYLLSKEQFLLDISNNNSGILSLLQINWVYGKQFSFDFDFSQEGNRISTLNFETQKISEGSYSLKYNQNKIFALSNRLEGTFMSTFGVDKFEAKIKGFYNYENPDNEYGFSMEDRPEKLKAAYDFMWTISADKTEFKSETTLNCDGVTSCYLTIHATPMSLTINTNFVKSISVEAKIENLNEVKGFKIQSKIEETVFECSGELSPKSVEGILKYKEQEVKFISKLHDYGLEIDAQISPRQRFAFFLNYTLGTDMLLELGLETPFQGWEKQDFRFSLNLEENIQGQISITWRNKHHIALTLETNKEFLNNQMKYTGSIRFSSTLENFERFEITLGCIHSKDNLDFKIEGKWNSHSIIGTVNASSVDDTITVDLRIRSSFAKDISLLLTSEISQTFSLSVDLSYDNQKSRALLKCNFTDSDWKNANISFNSSGPFLPEISVTAITQFNSTIKNIEIKGKFNGNKMLFLAKCETFTKNQNKICKISTKLITPSYKIFSGRFSGKINDKKEFDSDVELSLGLISDDTLKGSVSGKFLSLASAYLTGYITGPNINGKINLNHNISKEILQSEFKLQMNSFYVTLKVDGNVDLIMKEGSLHGEIDSSLTTIDGLKIMIQHSKLDEARETLISLSKKETILKIFHNFQMQDYFNWKNNLKINDLYDMQNEMMFTENLLKHISKFSWNEKIIDFTFQRNYDDYLNIITSLETPWTSLITVTVTCNNDYSERKCTVKADYGNKINLLVKTSYCRVKALKYAKISFTNKDWHVTPLEIEIKFSGDSVLRDGKLPNTFEASVRLNQIGTMEFHNYYKDFKDLEGELNIKINRNDKQFNLGGKYSWTDYKKDIYLEYEYNNKGYVDLKLRGDKVIGNADFTINVPEIFKERLGTNIDYNLADKQRHITVISFFGIQQYLLDMQMNINLITIKLSCPHGESNFNINYQFVEIKKYLIMTFKTSFDSIEDASLTLNYNTNMPVTINFEVKYGSQQVNIKGELTKNSIEVQCLTTLPDWEKINLKLKIEGSDFNGLISKNSQAFKFSGKANFNNFNGEGKLHFSLPYSGYQENLLNIKYLTQERAFDLAFNANIGSNNWKLVVQSDFTDISVKVINFAIQTPYEYARKIFFESKILNSEVKLIGNFNSYEMDATFKNVSSSTNGSSLLLLLKSNIPEWTSFSIESNIKLSENPYKASLSIIQEGIERKYAISLDFSQNNFNLDVETPILPIKIISINGNYKYEQSKLYTSFAFTKNTNIYRLSGHIDFHSKIPDIKLNILTPNDGENDIEFSINGSLESEKSLNMLAKYGSNIYKVNLYTDLRYLEGTASVKLALPIETFKDYNVHLSYDISSMNKNIKLDLKHGEVLEKYYIEGKLASNEFSFAIETPFNSAKRLLINGQYQKYINEYSVHGNVVMNDDTYKLEGKVVEKENSYYVEATLPISQYGSLTINGAITKEKLSLKIYKDGKEQELTVDYRLEENEAFIKVTTPFEKLSYFALGGGFEFKSDTVNGNIYIYKNGEHVEFTGLAEASPLKSKLKLSLKSSVSENYSLHAFYDLKSLKKEIGLEYENGIYTGKYYAEALYDGFKHGLLKVYTTHSGYEQYGFEYKYNTANLSSTEVFITIIKNSEETSIGLVSIYNSEEINVKILLPFTDYETFGLEKKFARNEGSLKIMVGKFIFSAQAILKADHIYFCIETPFNGFKIFKLISKYEWETVNKSYLFEFMFNDLIYQLESVVVTSLKNPEILFKIISPHNFIKEFQAASKFDIKSSKKLINLDFNYNGAKYFHLKTEYENWKILLDFNMMTPIENWTNIEAHAFIDLANELKIVDIHFKRDEITKSISLSGKLLEDETSFDINIPFESIGNFRSRGSLNRSKRSAGLSMKSSLFSGDIIANFNSLSIKAITPFRNSKDLNIEISKNNKGEFHFAYQRNNNQVYFKYSREYKKKAFSITVEGEIPGWEFLAITGRLDPKEVIAYIEGDLKSEMVHISGSGTFGGKTGAMTITTTSPYENYKEVITKIEYNAKRNIFTFDSQSTSSGFKILVEFKRGLTIDVFVPHELENTVAKGKLTVFKGNLSITSRFQSIRTFTFDYDINLGPKITAKLLLERNGLKIFELEFARDSNANTAHVMIHGRRGVNHSMFHFHREGWNKLEVVFERNGKALKFDFTGSGNLPEVGTANYSLSNSFLTVPKTLTGKIVVDRSTTPKKIHLEVVLDDGKAYFFDLTYNVSLQDMRQGDFILRTTTPDRSMAPWKDISGNWKIDDEQIATVMLKVGPKEYTANGKLSALKSELVLGSSIDDKKYKYYLQWEINNNLNYKDSIGRKIFVKIGPEDRYKMIRLEGNFDSIEKGDVEGAFKYARIMKDELTFTTSWSRSVEGLSGSGTFAFGQFSGTHTLIKLKRNPDEKATVFHWEATSNIPHYNSVILRGEYNLAKKLVDIKLSWDNDELYLSGSLNNMTLLKSENTIKFHIPKVGDGELTLTHDFSDPLSRSVKVVGNIGTRKFSYIANWTRNKDLTKFDLNAEGDSVLFGSISLHIDYDVRNVDDAKGSLKYKRNEDKFVTIDWIRKKTKKNLVDELIFSSHYEAIPNAKVYATADWSKEFIFDTGIEWKDQAIKAHLQIGSKNTTAYVKTPFSKFGDINVNIDYDLKKPKNKTVNLKYTRGDKTLEMNLDLKMTNKKTGSFDLTLTTPFEVLKTASFNAVWKKGDFTATYKRNDVTVTFEGKAEVKAEKSSFNLKFNLPNGNPIVIIFDYDLDSFIQGSEASPKDLIKVKLHINEEKIEFKVNGYRTPERIYLETSGKTSLEALDTFYLKLDSELNLNNREGQFEVKVNDFHFHVKNTFETRPKGFYARSQIHSTLTALPGLTIGFGRDGDSFIATTGYGDEREISFTFKGKDSFRKGFHGKIDIPRRGIHDLEYNINYSFKSDDKLQIDLKLMIAEGKFIEADILYNSDGVKARLSSPWTGSHSGRVRRSISDNYFMADIGVDNYGLTFESDGSVGFFKKGFKIQGEIFGEKILLAGFLNINSIAYSEGNFIIETPFENFKKLDGYFKVKLSDKHIQGDLKLSIAHTILLSLDIDALDKLKGNINLQINDLAYKIECNFISNECNIMMGNIIITTPHVTLEKIVIDGTINKLSSKQFQGSFSLDYMKTTYNMNIKLRKDKPNYSFDIAFIVDNNKTYRITSDYSLVMGPLDLKGVSSFFINDQEIISSVYDVSYTDLRNMHLNYEINWKNYAKYSVEIESNESKVMGTLTGNISDKNTFELIFIFPTHMDYVQINCIFEGKQKHVIKLEMKKEENYKNINLRIDCPNYMTGILNIVTYHNMPTSLKALVQIPIKFEFALNYKFTVNNPDGIMMVSEYDSLYHNADMDLANSLNHIRTREIEMTLSTNNRIHTLRNKFESRRDLFTSVLDIQSPLLPGNKCHLRFTVNLENIFMIAIESQAFDQINNIYIKIVKEYGIIIQCVSPYLPTGVAKFEGDLNGDAVSDIEFKLAYSDASETYVVQGKSKWNVNNKTDLNLKLRTPIANYEKVEFGFEFENNLMRRVALFAYPFNLAAESYFGIEQNIFSTGVKIKTGNENTAATSAEAVIPLNKFEPKFNAFFNGVEYMFNTKLNESENEREFEFSSKNMYLPTLIHVSYRNKAPYELNIEYNELFKRQGKLGVIFDSSYIALTKLLLENMMIYTFPVLV